MTHVTLSCGFEAEIDELAVNDMEFLDALSAMQHGDPTGMSVLLDLLMDKTAKAALYDACRNEAGRVPVEKVGEQLTELMGQLKSKKK